MSTNPTGNPTSRRPTPDVLDDVWPVVKSGFLHRYSIKLAAAVGLAVLLLWGANELVSGPFEWLPWWAAAALSVAAFSVAGPLLRLEMRPKGEDSERWWKLTTGVGTAVVRIEERGTDWHVTFLTRQLSTTKTVYPNGKSLPQVLMKHVVAAAPVGTRVWGIARPKIADRYKRRWGAQVSPRTFLGISAPNWAAHFCGYEVDFR